jgi:hypothetical protein
MFRKITLFVLIISFVSFARSQSKAYLIDELENPSCEGYLASMDNVTIQAKKYPASRLIIFVYEGKVDRTVYQKNGKVSTRLSLPEHGLGDMRIRSMKKYLGSRGAALERFFFFPEHFREKLSVEIWMVPEGASAPEPTPSIETMKYRKGRPKGFCMACCDW